MKFNKYIAPALAAAAMLFASSCTDSVEYTPTPVYEGDGVYFSQESVTNIDLVINATQTTVYINRVKAENELTVDLTSTILDADELPVTDIFTVPAQVTFAKGEKEAPINIAVAFDKIVAGQDYFITLKTETQTCDYGANEMTYTVMYSPWTEPSLDPTFGKEPCTATYTFPFNGALSFQQLLYVQNNVNNENIKRYVVPSPAPSVVPLNYEFDIDYSKSVEIDGDMCYYVRTPNLPFYDADPNGLCTLLDAYSWVEQLYISEGVPATEENVHGWMENKGWVDSYFNSRTGIATINMVAYPAAKEWGYLYNQSQPFFYTIEFPGYQNYAFNYSIQGNFVDVTGAESVMLQVFKSDNMAYFAAIAKPGALDEAGVAAAAAELEADNDKTFYSESGTTIAVPVVEEGPYTVVTIGYDEGYTAVYTQAYTFDFKTVQAENDWEDFGEADYTEAFLSSTFAVPSVTYPVKVQRHKQTAGLYRLVNPYADWSKFTKYMSIMASGNYYLNLDCSDPNNVNILDSDLGISVGEQFGFLSVTSNANLIYNAGNATIEELKQAGYYGKLQSGVVTFPTGLILAALSNMYNGEWAFRVNIDPDNPTYEDDYEGNPNPYWGNGLFRVAIYNLMPEDAPAKRMAPAQSGELKTVNGIKQSNVEKLGSSSRKVRKVSSDELQNQRNFNISRVEL